MPSIKLSIPHKLSPEEAKQRITRLLTEAKGQFGNKVSDVEESWTDNRGTIRFQAMGFPVSGILDVQPGQVNVEINLPFAALPFKSRITNDLAAKAEVLLA